MTTKTNSSISQKREVPQSTVLKYEIQQLTTLIHVEDGCEVVLRWRAHQVMNRRFGNHCVDIKTADGRCVIFDNRGLFEAQAEYWYERKIKALLKQGFMTLEQTHPMINITH